MGTVLDIPSVGFKAKKVFNTRLAVSGALTHHLQHHTVLHNPKWSPGDPKMADRVWKGVHSKVLGTPINFSTNNLFSYALLL